MNHSAHETETRNELLIWILIDAYREYPGHIDQDKFDDAVQRYQRELKKRGIELSIFFDYVTGKSKEVWNAGYKALEFGLLGIQRPGRSRAPIESSIDRYLRHQKYLSPEEINLAKEAAQITHLAEHQRKLDSDLEEGPSSIAT